MFPHSLHHYHFTCQFLEHLSHVHSFLVTNQITQSQLICHLLFPKRRGAMVLLQVVTPYALHRLLDWLEKEMRHNMSLNISEQGRSSALELIKIARHIITILHRCHLAIFYMSGVFYHIAKRFTGINYVSHSFQVWPLIFYFAVFLSRCFEFFAVAGKARYAICFETQLQNSWLAVTHPACIHLLATRI